MASVSGKAPPTSNDEVESLPSSEEQLPTENKDIEQNETSQTPQTDEQKNKQVEEEKQSQPSTSTPAESEAKSKSNDPSSTKSDVKDKKSTSKSSEENNKGKTDKKPTTLKSQDKKPATTKTEEKKSATTKSQEEKPATLETQEEAPVASESQEEKLVASESPEEKPAALESQEEKPETSEAQEEKTTIQESQEEQLTASEPQEEKPAESKPQKETLAASRSQEEKPATTKSRSVNFAATEDDTEGPKSRSTSSTKTRSNYSSSKSSHRPVDFIDALVESYKLETNNTSPVKEEKKYVPKTNRTRLNPNWREHRTRRLMNKLEELSLWDREEELKASQAQSLREQKWEQIQDRQRNHDLCLNLMRQRHESEMESAVILDQAATGINDENKNATIARAMNLATPAEVLAYDLPMPPVSLKRRVKQEQEKSSDLKTPIGRYRQFETNMNNKVEKINQKLQPDREIMRAYSPFHTSIPPTATPLFSETYSALLSVPDTYSSNKYNQYHYGVASYLHQPQHAASPDYETRLRSYSNRDVRVPLKEQANDYNYYDNDSIDEYNRSNLVDDDRYTKYHLKPVDNDYYSKHRLSPINDTYHSKHRSNIIDDDYHPKYRSTPIDYDYYPKHRSAPADDEYYPKHRSVPPDDDDYYTKYLSTLSSRLDYSPPRRTTSFVSPTAAALYDYTTVANTPRDYSFIHSRQPASTSIHLRSLNDDLNAITRFSTETSKKILQNINDLPNDVSSKNRSSSSSKRVNFNDRDDDEDLSYNSSSRNYSSKTMHQPEIISLSATR